MIDPITMAIDRILSARDRRMLYEPERMQEVDYLLGVVVNGARGKEISDNGFCQEIIIQALDIKYFGEADTERTGIQSQAGIPPGKDNSQHDKET